ncbi:MAG: leucyl aminopeptidase [Gammaproteobacteria bacterium]|nr:leucyl aminopeptidase [Gammaproteobacteria bacterium]
MRFQVLALDSSTNEMDTLVVGYDSMESLGEACSRLSDHSQKLLQTLIERGEIKAEKGQCHSLHLVDDEFSKLILVFMPKAETRAAVLGPIDAMSGALKSFGSVNAAISLPAHALVHGQLLALCNTIADRQYQFDHYRSGDKTPSKLTDVSFLSDDDLSATLSLADGLLAGGTLTKNLGNTPPNVCTPSYLVEQAHALADKHANVHSHALDVEQMSALGMGCLLGVGQGSRTPPALIVMQYQGAGSDTAPIALVGKGVTFDTGGISIKPSANMEMMTYDMLGAATVFGAIEAAATAKLALNIVAVVPSAENMPDGNAIKPGDVLTSMSGKTVEVLNTDAEGRLILCDALTYVQREFNPSQIIDMATLTGACITALGHINTAVMGNHQPLIDDIIEAGLTAYDPAWQLPLSEEYDEQLKSKLADVANIGGAPAGTITAGCFLQRFIENDTPWAHLDIAGTAMGGQKLATGRPLRLVLQVLANAAQQ